MRGNEVAGQMTLCAPVRECNAFPASTLPLGAAPLRTAPDTTVRDRKRHENSTETAHVSVLSPFTFDLGLREVRFGSGLVSSGTFTRVGVFGFTVSKAPECHEGAAAARVGKDGWEDWYPGLKQ